MTARPSPTDIRAAATKVEREACIDFIRDKMVEIDGMAKRHRVTPHEARLLNRRLDALADGIAAGLHR